MSDRLRNHLHELASQIEVPSLDVDRAVSGGRRRLLRRGVAVVAATAVVGVAVAVSIGSLRFEPFASEVRPAAEETPFQIPEEYRDEIAELEREQKELTAIFNRGDWDAARAIANERLRAAPDNPGFHGPSFVHQGNLILGLVALREGNIGEAERHLLAAGRVSGDPSLKSFGPSMSLARDLLLVGRRDVVLRYFDLVDRFWDDRNGYLPRWREYIEAGAMPDFGANLVYGGIEVLPIKQVGDCEGCALPPAKD